MRQYMTAQNTLSPETEKFKWILLPHNARKRYAALLEAQSNLVSISETSPFNRIEKGEGTKGIIACGLAYNYVKETLNRYNLNYPILKISQYPLPDALVREFFDSCESILIAEEGYPIYEELLHGYFKNNKLTGRLDGTLPRMGELTPDLIASALGIKIPEAAKTPEVVMARPPELCKGCSHRDLYTSMNAILDEMGEKHVFADIGCYTLGALAPFNAISTCVDMGASITMAKGASDAGLRPAIAVIGDSTFTHSGMTGLLDAVNDKNAITVIISDNSTTGMTGGQKSSGTGRIAQICIGLGVDPKHLRTIIPLPSNFEENMKILREEFEYEGVSVILANRECIQTLKRKK
jgi:indolepyruvate ferredoxin oxidoreductase alpha subunit